MKAKRDALEFRRAAAEQCATDFSGLASVEGERMNQTHAEWAAEFAHAIDKQGWTGGTLHTLAALKRAEAERDELLARVELVRDHAETDTAIRDLCRPLGAHDTDGDSYGVPPLVDVVGAVVGQLAAARADQERLKTCLMSLRQFHAIEGYDEDTKLVGLGYRGSEWGPCVEWKSFNPNMLSGAEPCIRQLGFRKDGLVVFRDPREVKP